MTTLIINTCKEKLHTYEFVKPIEDILKQHNKSYLTRHYNDITNQDLEETNNIIICGTSLDDFNYEQHLEQFSWITTYNKPLLGICAGMHIIGQQHQGTKKEETEIGHYHETFTNNFLGLEGEQEVYHLHNTYYDFSTLQEFTIFTKNTIPKAIKHTTKPLYGVLFHPEVRNKEVIINFVNQTL